ncbi:inosine 5'-monophosphate dehydrogenase [Streptococcus pneumoniae]|nr:inosine 5'-monophosphate dehydrogenase [Streptococcus pneumoniae]
MKQTSLFQKELKVVLLNKGAAADIVFQMIGGIRSGMGYCGAANLKELHDNAQFIEMSGAGLKESHPHDVQITNEAPNYSM